MFKRIGERLVRYGVLSDDELRMIVAEQRREYRPFGQIASEMFGVDEAMIWRAWAEQYATFCPRVNLDSEEPDPGVYAELNAEEAHAFRVLPLRQQDGDLILVTSEDDLPAALYFLDRRIDKSVVVWLAENRQQVVARIHRAYPEIQHEVTSR